MRPEIVVQSGHTLGITDLCFSPDSRFVATASADETVRIWDMRVGCEFRVLSGHQGPVYSVRYSSSGNLLATGGYDRAPRVWNAASGELIRVLEATRLPVSDLQFDGRGSRLISVSQEIRGKAEILVWNTGDWSLIRRFDLEYDRDQTSQCVAFHPDGSMLAVYYEKQRRVALLDIAKGKEKSSIRLPKQAATKKKKAPTVTSAEFAFTASGQALLACSEGKAILVPIDKPAKARPIKSAIKKVQGLSVQANGMIALSGERGFELWDAEATKRMRKASVAMRALNPDCTLAATANGRALRVIDVNTGAQIFELGERPSTPSFLGNLGRHYAVATNPFYPMIAWSGPDKFVRLWDLRSGQGPTIFKGSDHAIENLAFSPNGKALAAATSPIRIWNPWSAKVLAEVATESSPRHLAFSSSGSHLVTVGDRTLTVIATDNWASKEIKLDLKDHPSGIVFEPESDRFYVATRGGEWAEFGLGDLQPKVNEHKAPIGAVANNYSALALVYSQHKWIEGQMRSMGGFDDKKPQSAVNFLRDGKPMALLGGSPYVYAAAVSPDGALVATACGGGEINVWDPSQPNQPRIWMAHPGAATSIGWMSDGRFLVTTGMDGALRLWRAEDYQLAATLVSFSDTDYVIAAADGSYTASRGGLSGVVFRVGDRALPFDQFDLSLNRPDRVHESLGYAYEDLINSFRLAYEHRAKRMAVTPQGADHEMEMPDVKMLSAPVPLAISTRQLNLRVQVVPASVPLHRLLVYVNDVPFPNRSGFELGDSLQPVEREITLPLSAGPNRIEISALAADGVESLRQVIQTTQTENASAGKLFFLAMGVSNYREKSLSLRYAAKDAHDLADALQERKKHFASVETCVLADADASKKRITESRAFLERATVDDQVMIFFSGHGALFGYDYYFLPYDFDPDNPTATGLPYDSIEALVDGIAARKRLVLLDTCHAGEADSVVPVGSGPTASPVSGVKAYKHFGLPQQQAERHVAGVTDRTLAELFADLRRGAGAFVIGAAGADEYAVERENLANGVFTYCVLQGLKDSAADRNSDGVLRVSELQRYVSGRVVELTGGRQQPISRRENLRNDFVVI